VADTGPLIAQNPEAVLWARTFIEVGRGRAGGQAGVTSPPASSGILHKRALPSRFVAAQTSA